MKNNKLFNAISNIDEELISEAVNAPKKKNIPVMKFTAAAAALVFIALSASILVNVSKQPDIVKTSDTSNTNITDAKEQKDNSTPVSDNQKDKESKTEKQAGNTTQPSAETSEQPSKNKPEAQTSEQASFEIPKDDEEGSDMLGFIITDDGKTYMQVFNNSEYTLDEDIGRAGDFRGCYSDLDDNSRVYTVKEDERILVVKFESGGSVTLMLREEGLQDRMGYYRFTGLRVDQSVMAALSSNDGKAYSVYVTRPDSDDMYDYVYNGKTLRQMKEELDESWKTEHGKYNPLDEEYQAAVHAFLKEKIKAAYDILTAQGIKAELINEVRCEAEMTKEQFEVLAASNSLPDEYAFGLSSGEYLTDDEA